MTKPSKLTACVHAGGYVDPAVGGVTTPIYTSSSYRFGEGGVCYPRYYNIPTQQAAARKIVALENGEAGLVVGSGMAAISTTLFTFLAAGDHAVIQNDVYGGTFHFIEAEFRRLGIEFSFVQSEATQDFEAQVRDNTKLLYFETPTNPLLRVVDLEGMAAMAARRGLVSVIDNTFATPINQTPLDYGITVVVHSGTKYLGGHSDLCCGAVVTSAENLDRIRETAVNHGVVLSAFECYRLERSMKTLGVRVRQHNENGQILAEFLAGHPRVKHVNYPGLPDHPGYEYARAQMKGFGGMMSVELDGGKAEAEAVAGRLRVFTHAVSLGGVESLVCFPALTSHAKLSAEERQKLGITDSLIRISVGIEDPGDLTADWEQALGG